MVCHASFDKGLAQEPWTLSSPVDPTLELAELIGRHHPGTVTKVIFLRNGADIDSLSVPPRLAKCSQGNVERKVARMIIFMV